jgi:hypothetical protein
MEGVQVRPTEGVEPRVPGNVEVPQALAGVRSIPLVSSPGSSRLPAGEGADLLADRAGHLEQIVARGQTKDWPKLRQFVQEELQNPKLPAELRQELQALQTHARQLELRETCLTALRAPGGKLPDGLDQLPADLQKDFQGLDSLKDLQTALAGSWRDLPDVPKVRRQVDAVRAIDEKLADHLELHLALKAQAEGHSAAARQLLPSATELANTDPALRDLKAVAVDAIGNVGRGGQGPVASPVLPLPEPPAGGARPGVKESLRADLPPLNDEAATAAARMQSRVHEGLRQFGDSHGEPLSEALHTVLEYARMARQQEKEKERQKQIQPIVGQVNRPLTAAESILARVLREQGKTPAEAAAILAGLPPAAPKP